MRATHWQVSAIATLLLTACGTTTSGSGTAPNDTVGATAKDAAQDVAAASPDAADSVGKADTIAASDVPAVTDVAGSQDVAAAADVGGGAGGGCTALATCCPQIKDAYYKGNCEKAVAGGDAAVCESVQAGLVGSALCQVGTVIADMCAELGKCCAKITVVDLQKQCNGTVGNKNQQICQMSLQYYQSNAYCSK